jgi:hypothetical protein
VAHWDGITMAGLQFIRSIVTWFSAMAWWATIGPFCVVSDLPSLGTPVNRPLALSGFSDNYPVTELLGRLLSFRDRLRSARAALILSRAVLLSAAIVLVGKAVEVASGRPQTPWLPLIVFLVLGWSIHLALHHPIPPFDVARLVDRRLQLKSQIATAVETTTADRLDRPLARTQVRQATNCLRELNPNTAIPVRLPGRDLWSLAGVVAVYAILVIGARLGVTVPRPPQPLEAELARQARVGAQAPSPFVTLDPTLSLQQPQAAQLLARTAPSAQIGSQLNALWQELQQQQITADEYQNRLQQVQKQIESQASQSLAAQQALNALATSLKDVSATQGISDSLMRGDYKKASNGLNDLSKELGQLSPDARSQIADRLGQAATQTANSSPEMSKNSGAASSALKTGDIGAASRSIQSLAKSVDQAQQQIAAQSQLGQDLQNVQQQQLGHPQPTGANQSPPDSGFGTSQPNNQNSPGGQSSPFGGPGTPSRADTQGAGGLPDPASGDQTTGQNSGDGRAAVGSSDSGIQSEQGGGSGGVGDQAGGNPLGSSSALDVTGVKLTILGQSTGNGPKTTSAGDRSMPLTASNDGTISGMPSSGTAPSDIPINVHQDSNIVPLDRKPVVRDYFSDVPQ